jgi:DNA-binding NarL/FixJ family response regulator
VILVSESGGKAVGPNGEMIRILLAGRGSLFREAVRAVLEREPDLHVVGEASNGAQAIAEVERTQAQLAWLQSDLPNDETLRAANLIRKLVPQCRVAILADEPDHGVMIKALEAGATGYLTKESCLEDFIHAVRAIHRGEIVVPPDMVSELIARLLERRDGRHDALKRVARLTKREREVLALLTNGADNQAIADAFVISPQTARTHVQNLLGKLAVHSRLEAVAFVKQSGILDEVVAT